MAIYHLSMKIISRGEGQNAVASSSYRSGEKLIDEQTGEVKYYPREVSPESHILAPSNAPSWAYDRQTLWNKVEKSETRVNSRLAREIQIALPVELTNEQQTALIKQFIQENCVDKGMIADISIHRDNLENPHAHVMLTTREIKRNGFQEKNRDWNHVSYLNSVRQNWATLTNEYLRENGITEEIDHRSFKDRGIELLPTKHLGVAAHAMEKQGIKTDKGDRNRQIKAYNDKIISLEKKRQELLNAGYEQGKDKTKQMNLVVTYSNYMANQRDIRIAFNKINHYESMKKKHGFLTEFERKNLEKAQTELRNATKNKFEFLNDVTIYLNSNNSLLVGYANDFGKHMAKVARDKFDKDSMPKEEYFKRIEKRYSQQMQVRFANKMNTLQTNDFKTIITSVEKDMHFDKVKSLLKGWTNYETLVRKLNEVQEKIEQLPKTEVATNAKIKLINDSASLEYVKNFYETQALSELKKHGFEHLIERYDNPKYQHILIKAHEEIISQIAKGKSVTELGIERRVLDDMTLKEAQNVVRGNLSGINLTKRLDSYTSWSNSLNRQYNKYVNSTTESSIDKKQEIELNIKQCQTNISLLKQADSILQARAKQFLKEHPNIKETFNRIDLNRHNFTFNPMPLEDKLKANYDLFNNHSRYSESELIAKMYDNIMTYKEYSIEKSSKGVLTRSEYESYQATKFNLSNYERERNSLITSYEESRKNIELYSRTMRELEGVWKEKEQFEKNKASRLFNKNKLEEINHYLSDREITARTLSGAMNQVNYQLKQAEYVVNKFEKIEQEKIPALKNMLLVKENQAMRTVEKDFNLEPHFKHSISMPQEQKEILVSYMELKREYGVEDLAVERLQEKVDQYTAQYKTAEQHLSTLADLKANVHLEQETFNKQIDSQIKAISSHSYAKDSTELDKSKEHFKELREHKKEQNKEYAEKIKEIKELESQQREKKHTASNVLNVAQKFGNTLDRMTQQITQAEADAERRRRLRGLAEQSNEMELNLERRL
mgnify:CR=1 FL=1